MIERQTPLRVLIVDDSDDDTTLLIRALTRSGYWVENQRVTDAAELERHLERDDWDLVLSDWSLRRIMGTTALAMVRAKKDDVPFLFVSGTVGEDTAVRAMRDGAQDYIMKDDLSRLVPAVDREVRQLRHRRETTRLAEQHESLEVRFRKLISNAPDAVIVVNQSGTITLFNRAAERIFGYAAREIVGHSLDKILPQTGRQRRADREAAAAAGFDGGVAPAGPDNGDVVATDFEGCRKNGSVFPAEGTISNFVESGRHGTLLILRDVTQRRREEVQLKLLQRVTLDASAASNVRSALVQAIASICEAIEFGVAEAWVRQDGDSPTLVNTARHCRIPRFRRFHRQHGKDTVASVIIDESAGRARIECIDDIFTQPKFQRRELARETGLRSGVVVPVVGENGLLAVLLFLGPDPVEDHEWTRALLQRVSDQLAIVIDRKRATQRLEHMAHHDALTGLPNRVLFLDRLQQSLADTRRRERLLAVGFVDLDRFKQINDTYGHGVGDEVLHQAGRVLQRCLRAGDSVGRVAGDEFCFVLGALHNADEAATITERLMHDLNQPVRIRGHEITINGSVGLALYPDDATSPEDLMRHADIAMYQAKQQEPGSLRFFSKDMAETVRSRRDLETALRGAVDRGEFVLHYQPIVDVERRQVCGIEALLRWQTVDGTLLLPDSFIAIAEESGLIDALGRWVLATACNDWTARRVEFGERFRLSVNVSPRQFQRGDLPGTVRDALQSSRFRAEELDLEITEGVLLERFASTLDSMRGLGQRGVQFSIDDFGTGYSSLHYLKDLPIRRLKIDRSFVRDLPSDENSVAIVQAIVSMGRSLGLDVVAEGVETADQEQSLRGMGCTLMQGFLYCKAIPADDVLDWWRDWAGSPN